jgi:hypothetical protein
MSARPGNGSGWILDGMKFGTIRGDAGSFRAATFLWIIQIFVWRPKW